MPVITTLNFCGRTEEALTLYQDTLDAQTIYFVRFRDSPDQSHMHPGMEDLVFHATFRIEGTTFMASDVGFSETCCTPDFSGFALALTFESIDRAKALFDRLGNDGEVVVPLSQSAFTSWYGIVVDRMGISWKFNVDEHTERD